MSASAFERVAQARGSEVPAQRQACLHVVPDDPTPPPTVSYRPVRFRDIIGQGRLVMRLETHLNSAVARGVQPGHILLDGGPGLGKTTIGQAVAGELSERDVRSSFREVTADAIPTVRKLVIELMQLAPGDVWFVDEIQELKPAVQVALYKALEDGYMLVEGGGKDAAQRFVVPPFTMVGATTHPGKLTPPLRDRFKLVGHLEPYAFDDLALVLLSHAEHTGVDMTFEAADVIARASRYTPRRGIRLLEAVRDYAFEVTGDVHAKLDEETAAQGLEYAGVDRYGLDDRDRRVLRALCMDFLGGPVGLAPLACQLGMDPGELTKDVEPYLVQAGLWRLLPRGRAATRASYVVLDLPVPPLVNGLLR